MTIGVEAGKFLGMQRIFARISPNFPEKFLCDFRDRFSPTKIMKTFFGMTSKKRFHVFFCKRWVPFLKIKQRWTPFLPGFPKCLGVCLHPLLLHHWLRSSVRGLMSSYDLSKSKIGKDKVSQQYQDEMMAA